MTYCKVIRYNLNSLFGFGFLKRIETKIKEVKAFADPVTANHFLFAGTTFMRETSMSRLTFFRYYGSFFPARQTSSMP